MNERDLSEPAQADHADTPTDETNRSGEGSVETGQPAAANLTADQQDPYEPV
jgi:hypothetical protein